MTLLTLSDVQCEHDLYELLRPRCQGLPIYWQITLSNMSHVYYMCYIYIIHVWCFRCIANVFHTPAIIKTCVKHLQYTCFTHVILPVILCFFPEYGNMLPFRHLYPTRWSRVGYSCLTVDIFPYSAKKIRITYLSYDYCWDNLKLGKTNWPEIYQYLANLTIQIGRSKFRLIATCDYFCINKTNTFILFQYFYLNHRN